MAPYVLKTFDPSGRLIGREEFRAPRDHEAAATMRYLYEKTCCELWRGSRMVRVWDGAAVQRPATDGGDGASPGNPADGAAGG